MHFLLEYNYERQIYEFRIHGLVFCWINSVITG